MYRVYISNQKIKDIIAEQYIKAVSYQTDDIEAVLYNAKYLCKSGLTVIVEEEPTIARGE